MASARPGRNRHFERVSRSETPLAPALQVLTLPTTVAITGASGFIGRRLVETLLRRSRFDLRLLVRTAHRHDLPVSDKVTLVRGDMLDLGSLRRLVGPAQAVVNLAFLSRNSHTDNLQAAENLMDACAESEVARLVHCSTAVVAGAAPEEIVDENTLCRPATSYEATKLAIETAFRKAGSSTRQVVILRPTAVFGPGGQNLLKLADTVNGGNWLVGYVKRSVYGHRRMNAVGVDNVVGAIAFLIESAADLDGEILIVSDDEQPANNYRDIERSLRARLDRPETSIPPFHVPRPVLQGLLRLVHRSCANPGRIYDCGKLLRAGFVKPVSFDQSLDTFAEWYRNRRSGRQTARHAR